MTEKLKAHVKTLTTIHQIDLREVDDLAPEAAVAISPLRLVIAAPVSDETTYAVVLHEIGHLTGRNAIPPPPPHEDREHWSTSYLHDRLQAEDAAWAWARTNALEWTPVMEYVHQWARSTYSNELKQRLEQQIGLPKGKPLSQIFKKG